MVLFELRDLESVLLEKDSMGLWLALFLIVSGLPDDSPQNANRLAPQTRAGQIEIAREEKAANLQPEENSRAEHIFQEVEDDRIIERVFGGVAGWRLKLGGLVTRSGFAAGPEYVRRLAHDEVRLHASISGSTRHYYLMDAGLDMPHLASDHVFANFYAVHFDFPSMEYYGPGPNSHKTGRSDYLLENTSFQTRFGLQPFRHLRLGVTWNYLLVNVGPGRDHEYADAEQLYSSVPGMEQQAGFLQGGGFVQFDWRDHPLSPHSGGNYTAQFTTSDAAEGAYSFRRLDLEAQQYIPFFNERRTIALRARIQATDPYSGNQVPFYLQPTLGGADDLRGFRAFRFYDNASAVANIEYRWQIFYGMEMALFADAGQVYDRWEQINFRRLEKDFGAGWRFNMNNAVFMRIDAAFSREGVGIWLKFDNVF